MVLFADFLGVKNYPKYIFEKIHNQPVFHNSLLAVARFKAVNL